MSHGLGLMQRKVLGLLAAREIVCAEEAAQRQSRYDPPDEWKGGVASIMRTLIQRDEQVYDRWLAPNHREGAGLRTRPPVAPAERCFVTALSRPAEAEPDGPALVAALYRKVPRTISRNA